MRQIEVDFEVWQALVARLKSENHDFNDVLRDLLEMDPVEDTVHPDSAFGKISGSGAAFARRYTGAPDGLGFSSRGLFLPEGTQLRAEYKGEVFSARIYRGEWCHPDGSKHDSPSAAATAITDTNVNGLRFWKAKRPGDQSWHRLDFLRNLTVHGHG